MAGSSADAPRDARAHDAEQIAAHRERLVGGLRTFAANYTEITRGFADWLGLPARDAAALTEILYAEDAGAPLSPARLAERIGLTSGATTTLINRLEGAGYVLRTRESTDRRIVTLRYNPAAREAGRSFFGPFTDHVDTMISRYSTEQLHAIEEFLEHLRHTMQRALADIPPDTPADR